MRAWLAAHPEAQADWEAEAGLSEALGQLPDAPVPSNFTARVLQSVERESAAERRRRSRKWQLWPQLALAAQGGHRGRCAGRGTGLISTGYPGRPTRGIREKRGRGLGRVFSARPRHPEGLRCHPRVQSKPRGGRGAARGSAMNWAGRIGVGIAALLGAARLLCASPADAGSRGPFRHRTPPAQLLRACTCPSRPSPPKCRRCRWPNRRSGSSASCWR